MIDALSRSQIPSEDCTVTLSEDCQSVWRLSEFLETVTDSLESGRDSLETAKS